MYPAEHCTDLFSAVTLVFEAGAIDRVGPVTGLKQYAGSEGAGGVESLGAAAVRTLDACRGLRLSSRHRSTQRTALQRKKQANELTYVVSWLNGHISSRTHHLHKTMH